MSSERKLFYVAHPVSGNVAANLQRTRRWYRWLTKTYPEHVFIAPWIVHVEEFDDSNPEERAAGLDGDVITVKRCDGIVLVGGRLSEGMTVERGAATAIVDFLHLGDEPPRPGPRPEFVLQPGDQGPHKTPVLLRLPSGQHTRVFLSIE